MIKNINLKIYIFFALLALNSAVGITVAIDTYQTRTMLNARAIIQITNVIGNIRAGSLTKEEIERVKSLWHESEYDKVATMQILEEVEKEADENKTKGK